MRLPPALCQQLDGAFTMATSRVQVTVKPGPSVSTTAIHIDGRPVPLVHDQGSLNLVSPGRYIVVWHFAGNPGDSLGIFIEANGQTVLDIKKSRVPTGENAGAGIDRIEI
jgi:hypothetical protein